MFRLVCAVVLVCGGPLVAADRHIVVADDAKPFKVKQSEIVRIEGSVPSAGKLDAKINGPAKVENTNTITRAGGGIGAMFKEWELKPTGKGKVTVTITATAPSPSTPPKVTKYEFDVE